MERINPPAWSLTKKNNGVYVATSALDDPGNAVHTHRYGPAMHISHASSLSNNGWEGWDSKHHNNQQRQPCRSLTTLRVGIRELGNSPAESRHLVPRQPSTANHQLTDQCNPQKNPEYLHHPRLC